MASEFIFDSSAVLTVFLNEPGGETVRNVIQRGTLSSINYAEILARISRFDVTLEDALVRVNRYQFHIVNFDTIHAALATSLIPATKPFGLSLADRACLALAMQRKTKVYTADKIWTKLNLDVEIECIR